MAPSYRSSKAALNMLMRTYGETVKDRGVIVLVIAPGTVDTEDYMNAEDQSTIPENYKRMIAAGGLAPRSAIPSMIDLINHTHRTKIITIEDPIELVHVSNKALISQLEVGSDTEIADGWNVDWSVNLELVGSEAEGNISLLVGGQRLLRWQDAGGATLVQAQWLSSEPSPEEQQVYLATAATFARAREGRISLPGGQEALWALGHDQAERQIVVAMTWYCSNERTGVTRYGARRRMNDPGEAGWQAAVSAMAAGMGTFP